MTPERVLRTMIGSAIAFAVAVFYVFIFTVY